ncbi:hypothetical protein SAMN02745218_03004 [Desulfofundulus australicus DSM 11792]|uniref:Uncharacterized protein n=1 Tax=Desulfofundulus australicus DSM 11792 TaxID=1121425 RepID=A0A1M5E7D0_9FIRM|nr:hypothetical protein [Desulfofundulus australicus]SHF75096.1 hypothetical protein SAMN02745218_03004 [Desulfofundulus australicus DSM 11792]
MNKYVFAGLLVLIVAICVSCIRGHQSVEEAIQFYWKNREKDDANVELLAVDSLSNNQQVVFYIKDNFLLLQPIIYKNGLWYVGGKPEIINNLQTKDPIQAFYVSFEYKRKYYTVIGAKINSAEIKTINTYIKKDGMWDEYLKFQADFIKLLEGVNCDVKIEAYDETGVLRYETYL